MVKVSLKNERLAKPKFQQTRLCFSSMSSSSTISKKSDNYAEKLEQEILDLKINVNQEPNEHEDACEKCDKSRPRIKCTALKRNSDEPCEYSFCEKCIKEWVNEDIESIKNNDVDYVHQNGDAIQHRPSTSTLRWACLVCRGLCQCGFCSKQPSPPLPPPSKKQGSAMFFNMTPVEPPEVEQIDMLYSEEELWIRLQIREFVFRFGEIYDLDNRILSSLQNAQGDWKIKKLGAYLVFHFLSIISNATEYDPPHSTVPSQTIPEKAKYILDSWIKEKKLAKYYVDSQSVNKALSDILTTEGMTGRRWQDIAELLVLAEFEDVPIPTHPKKKEKMTADELDEDGDYDAMDIDDEEELEKQIERFRKPVRNTTLLTTQTELKLLGMLLELLLHHTQIRQSLSVPTHAGSTNKEVHDMALELKKYMKEYKAEAALNKSKRYKLTTRIHQLKAVRGKSEELKTTQVELDALETLIRDEHMSLETKKIQLNLSSAKSQKRFEPAGVDVLGNQYWIFNDLLDHLNYATDYRNSEPCWAYGIVIIGPGFEQQQQPQEQKAVKWWFLQGLNNMARLFKWIQQQNNDKELENLAQKIKQRMDHLSSLECVVYGEGFFA